MQLVQLVGWLAGRHEQHPIQRQGMARLFRQHQVSMMHRIECAPQ